MNINYKIMEGTSWALNCRTVLFSNDGDSVHSRLFCTWHCEQSPFAVRFPLDNLCGQLHCHMIPLEGRSATEGCSAAVVQHFLGDETGDQGNKDDAAHNARHERRTDTVRACCVGFLRLACAIRLFCDRSPVTNLWWQG